MSRPLGKHWRTGQTEPHLNRGCLPAGRGTLPQSDKPRCGVNGLTAAPGKLENMTRTFAIAACGAGVLLSGGQAARTDALPQSAPPAAAEAVARLADEVRLKGWVAFSARSDSGDWDLFVVRPDGSDRRAITRTTEFNEAGARFSPNGSRLLYYRMPRSEPLDNNTYGTFELVLADVDGSNTVSLGNDYSWASWMPDGLQLACLAPQKIRIIDIASRKVLRQLPCKGIVSQLIASPDGRRFVGTANGLGPFWNIGCLDSGSSKLQPISETERYNCTPDWAPDGDRVVYARGIIPEQGGRAELWVATANGTERHPLYAEAGRHIYGACTSPDGRHLLFTRSVEDLGKVDHTGTTLAIIRWSDTPMAGDDSPQLRSRLPNARRGPRLDLGPGWEPHWTATNLDAVNIRNLP